MCAPKRPLASADSAKSAKKLHTDDGSVKKYSRKRKFVDVSKQTKRCVLTKQLPTYSLQGLTPRVWCR